MPGNVIGVVTDEPPCCGKAANVLGIGMDAVAVGVP